MTALLNGLVPVFTMIALGHALRRFWLRDQTFWETTDKLGYFLLLPSLLFLHLTDAVLDAATAGRIAVAVLLPPIALFILLLAVRPSIGAYGGRTGAAFASLVQGTIRSNFFIALAAAPALIDTAGVTALVAALALYPALVNTLSVATLVRYAGAAGPRTGPAALVVPILRNPVVLSVIAGVAVNLSGLRLPEVAHATLTLMGGIALPLALLGIGAGLRFEAVRTGRRAIQTALTLKLVLMPALAWLAAQTVGLGPVETAAVVLFHCMPTAVTSYLLARQLGGDHELMAAIITLQTCCAAVTIPGAMLLVLPS